jgi:hypothetical protein
LPGDALRESLKGSRSRRSEVKGGQC